MAAKKKTLFLAQFSLLLAIEAIISFTPLGSLPALGPIVATLGMIPVAIAGILLGTGAGALMGASAGLFSFLVWTFLPPPQSAVMAFVFTPFYSIGDIHGNAWSLVICFVPRILTGVVASLIYKAVSKPGKKETLAYLLGGALGSLMNTFGVLGGIYLFFAKDYAAVWNFSHTLVFSVLGGQVLTSGIPEALLCALVAAAVCPPVKRILARAAQ